MTPAERRLRGQIGAHAMHAKHSGAETTAAARRGFFARFEIEVDPESLLPATERQRRACHAQAAYMTKLSLKAAQARSRRKAGA